MNVFTTNVPYWNMFYMLNQILQKREQHFKQKQYSPTTFDFNTNIKFEKNIIDRIRLKPHFFEFIKTDFFETKRI